MDNEMQQTNPDWYKDLQYQDVKIYIKDNINSASRSFVAIGYYLKYVRDNELFSEDGYTTIWEFAQGEFSIGKSSASSFMSINDKFSVDGNSPILMEQYKDFTSSKLAEMLTMTEEQLEQISPSTTIVEIREIKTPVETVLTSEQEMPSNCIHRPEFPCTLSEAQKVAQGDGEECNKKCCWGCPKHGKCGYECNASAHRPEATEIVSTEPEENRIPDPDLSCKFDPDARCVVASKESCKRNNDDGCMYSGGWDEEDYITADLVETVEADIIQTEPEECFADQCADRGLKFNNWLKANNFSIAQIVSNIFCDIPLANDKDPFLSSKVTNRLISSLIIKTDAYYSYLTKELDIEPEPVKSEQPELPILRNNDQRKAFIEAYETWPIWINLKETGERYYRYNFDNGESFIIRVSLCHKFLGWQTGGFSKTETEYSKREYFILCNPGTEHWPKNKTFAESGASMSTMVDYLKDFQKKGA